MKKKVLNYLSVELPKIDSKYNSINCGGCGFFAAALTKELSKLGISVSGHFLMDICGSPNIEELNSYLNKNSKIRLNQIHNYNIYCAHIFVKIKIGKKTYFIDSTGVYENQVSNKWFRFQNTINLSPEQTIELGVNKQDEWNDEFDRRQIPAIKKDVRKLFEKLAA